MASLLGSGEKLYPSGRRSPQPTFRSLAVERYDLRMDSLSTFTTHDLGGGLCFLEGRLPNHLRWDADRFQAAWDLHPAIRPSIRIHGRQVQVPRWQQAYGEDYRFSGQTSPAEPVPPLIAPLLAWARLEVHADLNAILVNWYEGPEHYIGPHHDTTSRMLPGAPIVTISFGEERVFRLSRGTGDARETRDFRARDGAVFVIPRDTNDVWKHSVPKSTRYTGRRISVTIRGFRSGDSLLNGQASRRQPDVIDVSRPNTSA